MISLFEQFRRGSLVLAACLLLPGVSLADAEYDALQAQVAERAAQLAKVRSTLAQLEESQADQASVRTDEITALKRDI
jgi:hypothetical protein